MARSHKATSVAYADSRAIEKALAHDARMKRVLIAMAVALAALVFLLVAYILLEGAPKLFDFGFLQGAASSFEAGGGIGAQLFNTWYVLVVTLLISIPISLGASIYLTQYARPTLLTQLISTAIEVLASLPSIIVGLFGFLTFVLYAGWGFSILSGALALTFFNLPILVRVMCQAFESVPRAQRDAALALGLTRWEACWHVLLPEAMPTLVTGVILCAGRVLGESATLIYTAGQSSATLNFANFNIFSPSCPWNLMRPAETLAVHIWKINSESVLPDVVAVSAGAAAVLLVCILIFNIAARIVSRRLSKKVGR